MSDRELPLAYLESDTNGEKTRYVLDGYHILRIGRSEAKNTVVLDDTVASREHAILQRSDTGECYLTDLNSINGTFVNGEPIFHPTVLRPGDSITIGRHQFTFHQETCQPQIVPKEGEDTTRVFRVQKVITVLVIDIRDFTALTRRIGAERVSEVAGFFFRKAGKLLQQRGAWRQKYTGDGIMAIWIHNPGESNPAKMHAILDSLWQLTRVANSLQVDFGLDAPIRIGAGANTGAASVGNLGSSESPDYTALGDVVNKAFRLEAATKELSFDLLIGQETLSYLDFEAQAIFDRCTLMLKGYDEATTAYGTHFAELKFVEGAPY